MTKLCSLLLLVLFSSSTLAAQDPNVLFIAVDDLNDWVGPLGGHPQAKTPNMDALAARGTTFTNAHCQSPLCNPSRTSFLLSRRPTSTGLYALNPSFREIDELTDTPTVLQHFHGHGYETYCVGKIFHNAWKIGKLGRKQIEADHFGDGQSPNPMPSRKISGQHPIEGKIVDWGPFEHDMRQRCDFKTAQWTIGHLNNRDHDRPFFMACGFYLPHVPIYTTRKWHDLYPIDSLKLPDIQDGDRDDCSRFASYFTWRDPYPKTDWLRANKQLKPLVQSYLAAISYTDHQIGRVLHALEDSGQADNTIVVVFSDHGFHCGEKGVSGKHTLWSESTRVPLIFAGPGVGSSQHCGEAVELLDLYPTLCQLCGLPVPDPLEGLSIVSQLRNPAAKRKRPAICTNSPGSHSVVDERWRFIQYADGSQELYDRQADPGEHSNLIGAGDYTHVVKELARWIPQNEAEPVPGSLKKMVSRRNGRWYYEDFLIEEN